ncbi:MAG: DNA mismatch repair protein MutS [Zetaproteobacteria bacterium]|nr:DNA mismatch repair protein MutS [Zetaproteobacteria bacterium]
MSESKTSKLTPMMQQVELLREKAAGAILFFRMGDFYEVFGDQAELVAPLLEIALTSREKGNNERIAFCGVPHHSATGYWQKLVSCGYKVAIGEQVEDAKHAKGLVKRDIVRIYTPATVDDPKMLVSKEPCYLASFTRAEADATYSLLLCDLSTGEIRSACGLEAAEVLSALQTARPREILVRRFELAKWRQQVDASRLRGQVLFEELAEGLLRDASGQMALLHEVFGEQYARALGNKVHPGLLAATLDYYASLGVSTKAFLKVQPLHVPDTFRLPENVVCDLEIFETSRSRERVGSFLHAIDNSQTPIGARHLRANILQPFQSEHLIRQRRQQVVEWKGKGEIWLDERRKQLGKIGDLERLATRLAGCKIKPAELKRLALACCEVQHLEEHLPQKLTEDAHRCIERVHTYGNALRQRLQDQPAEVGAGDGVFRSGVDVQLDQYNELAHAGDSRVNTYLESLREQTGIQSLKVKQHKTFGLVLEVTKSNLHKVPAHFIRRQTMVNCERFVTEELRELDESLSQAQDQAIWREAALYQQLLEDSAPVVAELQQVSRLVAEWDVVQSLAYLAQRWNYVQPQTCLGATAVVEIKNSRHPVIEQLLGAQAFTANDIYLGDKARQVLITGPNMAGKSTLMRQVALSALLHQIGGFVPASSAKLPIFDGIYTRVGASDDLASGLSTFMVEMSEASLIAREATAQSLVILDELGRGTSSEDGLAIASAVLIHLSTRVKCWALFATHFHELAYLAAQLHDAVCLKAHVSRNEQGRIRFSHRITPGVSESSYGVEVAELAGLPAEVLADARKTLRILQQKNTGNKLTLPEAQLEPQSPAEPQPAQPRQMSRPLFPTFPNGDLPKTPSSLAKTLTGICEVDLDHTTPMEALKLLQKFQGKLRRENVLS